MECTNQAPWNLTVSQSAPLNHKSLARSSEALLPANQHCSITGQALWGLTASQSALSNHNAPAHPPGTLTLANQHPLTTICPPGPLGPNCQPISTLKHKGPTRTPVAVSTRGQVSRRRGPKEALQMLGAISLQGLLSQGVEVNR